MKAFVGEQVEVAATRIKGSFKIPMIQFIFHLFTEFWR